MDITGYVIGGRDEALLLGDYNSYRAHLSNRLRAIRRRLGLATPKNAKYQPKAAITAENVKSNVEYAHLLLFSAEREWAAAMSTKSSQSEDNTGQGVSGATRSHVVSKLVKASKHAEQLLDISKNQAKSGYEEASVLEITAYHASLAGAAAFEKQSEGHKGQDQLANKHRWDTCLMHYATARVIYGALHTKTGREVLRDILANTVDPTIRYAAYQARLSRSIAVSSVAIRYFPKNNTVLADQVRKLDTGVLEEQKETAAKPSDGVVSGEIPKHIAWRGRNADLVDAIIGQALAQALAAEARLKDFLVTNSSIAKSKRAAAYDEILIARQDAVDTTRRATEELEKEGVEEGDARMQNLRISSLAVNYDLVSWRVGRNRILIGDDDGRTFAEPKAKVPKRPRRDGKEWMPKPEPRAKKLARLKERVVLYDTTIQSIDTVKDLRGAMRDPGFVQELDGKRAYFQALKCLNIANAHNLLGHRVNALALLYRAHKLASQANDSKPHTTSQSQGPPTLYISSSEIETLETLLQAEVARQQAICEIHKFYENAAIAAKKEMVSAAPLVQRLNDFPTPGVNVDLTNLVQYPPKIQPIPVKPLFLDVAWNYLEYPGRAKTEVEQPVKQLVNGVPEQASEILEAVEEQPKKRGWFGFGR